MRARILGSAAGGGFPQWNCRCPTCEAARTGAALPRTQSSLAIRGDEGPWWLANASPDLRQQLEALAPDRVDGVRAAPVAGVLLTDAEIDHTAGLLLLRESGAPVPVYGSEAVRRALTDGFPVLRILGDFCGADWRTLEPGAPVTIEGSSLEVEAFAAGGDAPRYLAGAGEDVEAAGLLFRDRVSGGVLTYVPGLARLDDDILARLGASDVALVDGTFWRDDELARLGISERTAGQMGHVPLSGPGGALEALARLERPRVILVHINNTNPILHGHDHERDAGDEVGAEADEPGDHPPELQPDQRHERREDAEQRRRHPGGVAQQAEAGAGDHVVDAERQGQAEQRPALVALVRRVGAVGLDEQVDAVGQQHPRAHVVRDRADQVGEVVADHYADRRRHRIPEAEHHGDAHRAPPAELQRPEDDRGAEVVEAEGQPENEEIAQHRRLPLQPRVWAFDLIPGVAPWTHVECGKHVANRTICSSQDGPLPKIPANGAPGTDSAGVVRRAEMIALASPPCHECGAPVERVELRWHLDEDDRWRPGPYFMVCGKAHRVLVEPLA